MIIFKVLKFIINQNSLQSDVLTKLLSATSPYQHLPPSISWLVVVCSSTSRSGLNYQLRNFVEVQLEWLASWEQVYQTKSWKALFPPQWSQHVISWALFGRSCQLLIWTTRNLCLVLLSLSIGSFQNSHPKVLPTILPNATLDFSCPHQIQNFAVWILLSTL